MTGSDIKWGAKRFGRANLPLAAALAILIGLGGCAGTPNDTFDLASVQSVQAGKARVAKRQILVADPTALKVLDSDNIVVRVSGTEMQYLAKSQWSDKLPRLVQSKLVSAFESTGKLAGVGKPGQGLAIDFQLISDIRSFEINTAGSRTARVEISVKLLNDRNGTVIAQRTFSAAVASRGSDNQAMINALSQAFGQVSNDIVGWTLSKV